MKCLSRKLFSKHVLITTLIILIFSLFFQIVYSIPTEVKSLGEKLFKDEKRGCIRCHTIGKEDVDLPSKLGADLKDIHKRRSKDWLIKWIRSPQAMLDSGDLIAKEVRKKFTITMPDQNLSDSDIYAILDYIEKESSSIKEIKYPDGQALFKSRCNVCHSIGDQKIGEDLKGVHTKRSQEWLIKWIKSPENMIKDKDPAALALKSKYKGKVMPSFSDLSDDEIKAIINFIGEASATNDLIRTATKRFDKPIDEDEKISEIGGLKLDFSALQIFIYFVLLGILIIVAWKKYFSPVIYVPLLIIMFLIAIAYIFVEMRSLSVYQGYEPDQPIKYSHVVHAKDNNISCLYCHFGAEKSKHAGIPPVNVCMNCHSTIKTDSIEIKKIYDAVNKNNPIQWIKVHNLPDHVYFNHSQHIVSGGKSILGRDVITNDDIKEVCFKCHGPVDTMETVKQYSPLTMGWCVNCHRKSKSPFHDRTVAEAGGTDCARCHY